MDTSKKSIFSKLKYFKIIVIFVILISCKTETNYEGVYAVNGDKNNLVIIKRTDKNSYYVLTNNNWYGEAKIINGKHKGTWQYPNDYSDISKNNDKHKGKFNEFEIALFSANNKKTGNIKWHKINLAKLLLEQDTFFYNNLNIKNKIIGKWKPTFLSTTDAWDWGHLYENDDDNYVGCIHNFCDAMMKYYKQVDYIAINKNTVILFSENNENLYEQKIDIYNKKNTNCYIIEELPINKNKKACIYDDEKEYRYINAEVSQSVTENKAKLILKVEGIYWALENIDR